MERKIVKPWYNFVTGEMSETPPDTDEQARQYLSQRPSAQMLYEIYREMGYDIVHAMIEVHKAVLGLKD
jgi:hypothetical protein